MSKSNRTHRRKQRQDRRLRIRGIRRNPPDPKKFGGAIIELVDLAQAQAEADAEAEQARRQARQRRRAEHQENDEDADGGQE